MMLNLEFESIKHAMEQWVQIHPLLAGLLVFLLTFTESIAIIGLLIPGSVLMTTVGALVGAQIMPAGSTIIWAALGAILGDGISYLFGYHYKEHLRDLWIFKRYPRSLILGEGFFKRHGGKSVFLGRIGPLRAIVPMVAGMLHMRPWRFFVFNIPSSIIWAPVYMIPGILLGAASLALPPELASKFLGLIFIILLILWLCGWLLKRIFFFLLNYADRKLDQLWQYFLTHPRLCSICRLLQDPRHPDKHGQITLALIFIISSLNFLVIAFSINHHGFATQLNLPLHHFMRSFYDITAEKIAFFLSMLGEKTILLPTLIILTLYFVWRKNFHAAIHWFAAGFITAGIAYTSKYLIHSPRPVDIFHEKLTNSFPSGHTVLAIIFFGMLTVLITRDWNKKFRWLYFLVPSIIVLMVAITRLYLGLHWFTDILGSALLGIACLSLVTISYFRHNTPTINVKILLSVFFSSFLIFSVFYVHLKYPKALHYTQPTWPHRQTTYGKWWQRGAYQIPLYRSNRFGKPLHLINIEWAGELENIKHHLSKNGWQPLNTPSITTTIRELIVPAEQRRRPLMTVFYQDREPSLVMSKHQGSQQALLVLRLWQTEITFNDSPHRLWLGDINYFVAKHYDLLHHKEVKRQNLALPLDALKRNLRDWQWRLVPFPKKNIPQLLYNHPDQKAIILIRP